MAKRMEESQAQSSAQAAKRAKSTAPSKGKEKVTAIAKEKKQMKSIPVNPSTPTEENASRGIRFKSTAKRNVSTQKPSAAQEVTFIGNPLKKFRDRTHEARYLNLDSTSIVCGRDIDWRTFESYDFHKSLYSIFKFMKWEKLSKLNNMLYSESLVKSG